MPALIAAFGAQVVAPGWGNGPCRHAPGRFADPRPRRAWSASCIRLSASWRRALPGRRHPYVILAVPLLVESGTYRERCDRIVVVDCPESLQVERVMSRSGIDVRQVLAIMAAQASRAERLAVADDIVLNDGERANPHNRNSPKYLRLSAEKVKAGC